MLNASTTQLLQLLIVVLAAASVAIADVLIKRITANAHSFTDMFRNPLMIIVVGLYLAQIVLYSYVFFHKWDLTTVGVVQTLCYAAIVIIFGVVFFHEHLTITHGIGIVAGLIGIVLMNT